MKTQKIIPALIGILMIVLGCLVLFDTLYISPRMWFLPVVGAVLLFFAIKSKNSVLRDIGIISLILGVSVIINEMLIHPIYSRVFYLAVTSACVFLISALRKNGWLVLLGTFSLLISAIMFLEFLRISGELKSAYTLILIATAFVVLFIVKNDKLGFFPLVAGILCYLMSLPRFLMNAGYITSNIAQVISAALLIVTGILLVFLVYNKTAKENECE